MKRILCTMLALMMVLCSFGCAFAEGGIADPSLLEEAAPEQSADEPTVEEMVTGDDGIPTFDYSAGMTEDGYFNVRALDYVTLPEGYATIEYPEELRTVSDETMQGAIDSILAEYITMTPVVDRAAVNGDSVNIDYVGSVGGVVFEGGTATAYDITLGSNTFIEGFEAQIVGHMPGETFTVNVVFPNGYPTTTDAAGNTIELANQPAQFEVTLNFITVQVVPELTDEFVQQRLSSSYPVSNVEEFMQYMETGLLQGQLSGYFQDYLMANCVFAEEMPEVLLNYYRDYLVYNFSCYAVALGMSLDEFMALYGTTTDAMLDSQMNAMLSSIQYMLAVQAIAETEGFVATPESVQSYADRYYGGNLEYLVEKFGYNYVANASMMDDLILSLLGLAE